MTDDEGDGVSGGDADAPRETDAATRVVERVAEHDEELAAEVRRLVDPGDDGAKSGARATDEDADAQASGEAADADAGDGAPEGEPAATDRVEELQAELQHREERIADLEERLDEREQEVEDLQSQLKRKQADFQNYKKRAERKREDLKERATEDLVERLLDVRDNLRRGLEADHENVESLRDGVEMTLTEFDRVLEEENVTEIAPDPGEEIDPARHEVMMRVDAEVPEDTVADLYAPGYEMADRVLRAAQVTVSTGAGADDAGADGDDATGEESDGDDGAPRATAGESDGED